MMSPKPPALLLDFSTLDLPETWRHLQPGSWSAWQHNWYYTQFGSARKASSSLRLFLSYFEGQRSVACHVLLGGCWYNISCVPAWCLSEVAKAIRHSTCHCCTQNGDSILHDADTPNENDDVLIYSRSYDIEIFTLVNACRPVSVPTYEYEGQGNTSKQPDLADPEQPVYFTS